MKSWIPAVCAATFTILAPGLAQADDLFHPAPHPRPGASFQGYIYVGKPDGPARDRQLMPGLTNAVHSSTGERIYQHIGADEP